MKMSASPLNETSKSNKLSRNQCGPNLTASSSRSRGSSSCRMFSASTQRKFWMFSSEEEVADVRRSVHEKFVKTHGGDLGASQRLEYFLTLDEANTALRFYEEKLLEFLVRFNPPMPKGAQGTAIQYFKRFYLNNSVMDFHPKEIL